MIIREIICKSALTGKDGNYTLNPYVGCQHGCSYCYATYITRWKNENAEWGKWVHVKTNIADVLEKELQKKSPSSIFMSTVCDIYQPQEKKYKITRKCLEVMSSAVKLDSGLKIIILTKSDLILRDLDILKRFPFGSVSVGFSVNTMDNKIALIFEHDTPYPSRRLNAAIKLKKENIRTGIYINPILPYITERELPSLIQFVSKNNLDFAGFDTLNYIKGHVGKKIRSLYKQFGKDAVDRLNYAASDSRYSEEIREEIKRLTAGCGASVEIIF